MFEDEQIIRELIMYSYEKMENNHAYPFCAFIVKDSVIISKGFNDRINSYGDKTTHGEMEAMKKACIELHSGIILKGYSLYSTCEPCLACFDSALWSQINRFVFSVSHNDFPEYFNDHPYSIKDYQNDNPNEIMVVRDVLHEEGIRLFKTAKDKYGW